MIKHKSVRLILTIFIGLLIIFLLIIGLLKLIESSRLENNDYKPDIQPNAVWKCTDPNIEFEVNNFRCFGQMNINSETVFINISFGPGRDKSVRVDDIHTNDFSKDRYYSTLVFLVIVNSMNQNVLSKSQKLMLTILKLATK